MIRDRIHTCNPAKFDFPQRKHMKQPSLLFIFDETSKVLQEIKHIIQQEYPEFIAQTVESKKQFLKALEQNPAIILADFDLESFSTLEALTIKQEHHIAIPLIAISSNEEISVAVEAMKLGAADYIMKDTCLISTELSLI